MNHTQYSVLCLKRICIYQLTLVLCTVSVAREPKSNVLVFIVGNTPPSEAWQRTGEFTVSFLGSDVSIIVLCVWMSSSLSTTAGYSTFIATLFTSYFMCQYIRLNPEKIFEELQACPKEVCMISIFRLVCAIRPWSRCVWWIWLFLFSLVHQTSSRGIPPCHTEAYHT